MPARRPERAPGPARSPPSCCAGWPATPASRGCCSTRPGRRWTSAASTAPSPPGIWAALVARDRGCANPGCTRPSAWCQAHHIRFWGDGGDTKLDNLVLLCGEHHRVVHHHGWDVRIGPDGHPEFLPPPWVDADRTPRRNPYWHLHDRLHPLDGP